MLTEQRRRVILDHLSQAGWVSISQLCDVLGVSRETIRRDMSALAIRGLLRQTRGGAMLFANDEPTFTRRRLINIVGKRAIGRTAVKMIKDGNSVILDSGTTTECIADMLSMRSHLKIYTNDLTIAKKLVRYRGNRVLILGGEIQEHEDSTLGLDAINTISQYHADFAFVGAGGITNEGHLTDYSREAAELRHSMLSAANIRVVVADHTKFGRTTPVRVLGFDKVTHLITDRKPDLKMRRILETKGIKILIAQRNTK